MSGFATVIARIREDLDRGTDFDSRIKRGIEDAIFYYRAVRFGFNSKRKTFSVSAEYTSLTANWIEADYLTLELSDARVKIVEKTPDWINEEMVTPDFTGEPRYFAIQNRQLRLYPPPDQSYSVQMSYLYDLQEVSSSASDSASNAWTGEAEPLIRMHTMVDLLELYVDGPESHSKAERYRLRESEELKQLKRRANREQGAGVIEPWL
jgi:hypothetical protein